MLLFYGYEECCVRHNRWLWNRIDRLNGRAPWRGPVSRWAAVWLLKHKYPRRTAEHTWPIKSDDDLLIEAWLFEAAGDQGLASILRIEATKEHS